MYDYIGGFELFSNKVIIADPFYISDEDSRVVLENITTGAYFCFIQKNCSELLIYHSSLYQIESFIFKEINRWQPTSKDIPVDQGMAGIYDFEKWSQITINESAIYPKNNLDDPWLSFICDLVDRHSATSFETGCVSTSGDGDGTYPVFTLSINGALKGIKITF